MSKQKVLIEVRGGTIVFTAATSKMDICIVDHDGDVTSKNTYDPDKVMDSKSLNKYISKVSKEPGNQ